MTLLLKHYKWFCGCLLMFNDAAGFDRVFIACGYTDLRYGIDGLSTIVQNTFHLNPFSSGTLFLFCGRKSDRIKGLLWEEDGFLLLYKRLEKSRFQWPRTPEQVQEMTPQQFRWLMEGLSINQKKAIQKARPKRTA